MLCLMHCRLVELDLGKDESHAILPASRQQQQQQANTSRGQLAADNSNDSAGFADVAVASDSFEVCRLFAAMLQLVNNR
jgi:hypothetical protein